MNKGGWQAIIQRVVESKTQLSTHAHRNRDWESQPLRTRKHIDFSEMEMLMIWSNIMSSVQFSSVAQSYLIKK